MWSCIMPIFNFNTPRTPDELLRSAETFFRDLFGEMTAFHIESSVFEPPEGSRIPQGLRQVKISTSARAAEKGDYFSFLIGFRGETPYIYEKETYQPTSPGYLPVNEDPKKGPKYYEFGSGESAVNVLDALQHIFTLHIGAIVGRPGGAIDEELENMDIFKRVTTARQKGTVITVGGREVNIAPMPFYVKPEESSAREIDQLMAGGPIIGLQNVRSSVFNAAPVAEEETVVDAVAGRIKGLTRDFYGIDATSKTHRLAKPTLIGYENADNTVSAFTDSITKGAHILNRPTNPLMIFSGKKATPVPDVQSYREQTAVMERGDPVHKQLVLKSMSPVLPGGAQEGAGPYRAPEDLLKIVRSYGKHARLEATFRSIIDSPIYGFKNPQDLIYTDEEGAEHLRFEIADRFLPENLAEENVIESASTFRIADFLGKRGGHLRREAVTGTTKQRHYAVENTIITLPLEWYNDPEQKKYMEETLFPMLKGAGFGQIEFRPTEKDRRGTRSVSIGLNVLQGDTVSLKNQTKVTNVAMPKDAMALWQLAEGGNLVLDKSADAFVPFKTPEGVMWSRFNVASKKEQMEMLFSMVKEKDVETKKAIKEYYRNLGDQPAAMAELAPILGVTGPMPLLEKMTGAILGRKRVLVQLDRNGNPVIDETVRAKQDRAYEKYGIGRSYGYAPFGYFTEETQKLFVEDTVRNLIKHAPRGTKLTEEQH